MGKLVSEISRKAFMLGVPLLCMSGAFAETEFDGIYAGIDGVRNKSMMTGRPDRFSNSVGYVAGYNWDMEGYLLGINGFYDRHSLSYTRRDGGVDLKLGMPRGSFMPYAKLGIATSDPGTRPHGGIGIEYKLSYIFSLSVELNSDVWKGSTVTYKNTNLAIGLNLYPLGFDREEEARAARAKAKREAYEQARAEKEAAEAAARKAAEDAAAAAKAAQDEAAAKAAQEAAAAQAARAAAVKEAWKTSIIETPVRLEGASFSSGSSKLRPGATGKLDEVVKATNAFPDIVLEVSGYTDNIGSAQKNLKLSQDRADAVKAYLVGKGVAADRITSTGYGVDNPVADNATRAGRAKNRRVEVKYVIRQEQKVRVTE